MEDIDTLLIALLVLLAAFVVLIVLVNKLIEKAWGLTEVRKDAA